MKTTLSPRQLEVLRILSGGHPRDKVAEALGVSTSTIDAHLKVIYAKFDVSTLVEAVVIAVRQNII
jgi:DNA-binding CsgD family transcriptional regulator